MHGKYVASVLTITLWRVAPFIFAAGPLRLQELPREWATQASTALKELQDPPRELFSVDASTDLYKYLYEYLYGYLDKSLYKDSYGNLDGTINGTFDGPFNVASAHGPSSSASEMASLAMVRDSVDRTTLDESVGIDIGLEKPSAMKTSDSYPLLTLVAEPHRGSTASSLGTSTDAMSSSQMFISRSTSMP